MNIWWCSQYAYAIGLVEWIMNMLYASNVMWFDVILCSMWGQSGKRGKIGSLISIRWECHVVRNAMNE